jgi:hypothetical protein
MTNIAKVFLSLVSAVILLSVQVGGVFATPIIPNTYPLTGVVQGITLESDTITGVTIVSVDIMDADQAVQSVRMSQETAIALGLVVLSGDGKPEINNLALGQPVEIDQAKIIPVEEENQHPVGSALATFFSDIPGIDYETIMATHEQGVGFGVLAQTLWLTTKLEGSAEVFEALIHAKQTGDYSAFILEDGSSPQNWGQLRKAILAKDKKNNLGVVISNSNNSGNGTGNGNNGNGNNDDKDQDKEKDKNNDNDKDKNKDKEKKK